MLTLMMLLAAASPAESKTMASDSWHNFTITWIAPSQGAGAPLYLRTQAADWDGDGVAEEGVLKLICVDGSLKNAFYNVSSPRDSASGMASGKRTHNPVKFIKEWGPSTPQLRELRATWNLKELKSARVAANGEGWSAVTLGSADGLCAAASAAAASVSKSRSNIKNN